MFTLYSIYKQKLYNKLWLKTLRLGHRDFYIINKLDGVPVPERAKAATRQMIIYNF